MSEIEPFVEPKCRTCGSLGRRCTEPDGSLAWPWHITRTVDSARMLLSSAIKWDDNIARQRHVDLVLAYELGKTEGRIQAVADTLRYRGEYHEDMNDAFCVCCCEVIEAGWECDEDCPLDGVQR